MEPYRFDFLLDSTDISIILRLNREKQCGDSVESAWPYAPEKCFFSSGSANSQFDWSSDGLAGCLRDEK